MGGVALLLVCALAVDVFAGAVSPPSSDPVSQGAATSGIWYCPAVAGAGERAVLTVAAVSDRPSSVHVQRYVKGVPKGVPALAVAPGKPVTLAVEGAEARAPSTVSWSGGPVTVTWRADSESLTAVAPCEPSPAERWYIPGFNTSLGSTARLQLFNAFPGDAVVRLLFVEPTGTTALALADNIVVKGHSTRSEDLHKYRPIVTNLGVVVEVLAGRVVAQGQNTVKPPRDNPGPTGRMLLRGAPEPSAEWSFPLARSDEGAESWLSVINTADRPAAVEVRVSDPLGRGSAILGEQTVPARGSARIELAQASRESAFGVSIAVVNDASVVATLLSSVSDSAGQRGLTATLGAPRLSTRWALTGAGTGNRDAVIAVYNPLGTPATVDLLAPGAPAEWSDIRLRPNGLLRVPLSAAGTERVTVDVAVAADAPVVAGLRSTNSSGGLRPWTIVGVPAEVWLGPTSRPAVRLDPGLATRSEASPTDSPQQPVPGAPAPSETQSPVPPAPSATTAAAG
jgi:hypothetical protein